ncbi:TlpA disulfide reductase family protein [Sulfuriflexus sp.]|uniref:TlpA family protein disulfide reductase n=1 Tax=Sulfuriflexus sp. TaxID=2015443 RepID=UPI0028CD4D5D|nr:TlpA disulfide reductase family protein [Sulfuriflexus sp.]MDT8404705.1 TlpA disulfide reductase family protein [Sulfuriflexus sp.]
MNKFGIIGLGLAAFLLTACGDDKTNTETENVKVRTVVSTSVIGSQRPGFALPDTSGSEHNIGEWDGKVLVINFWATWCPPCRKEMPAFIELQDKFADQGLQFIGVAIDDADKVKDFMDTYGVNYPMLLGDLAAIEVGKQYGNRFGALPYTVIVDREGKIAFTRRGELEKHEAETEIKKLL